jgi:hypothetical protein
VILLWLLSTILLRILMGFWMLVVKSTIIPVVEVDMVTSLGATPLTEASIFGWTEIIEMLK